MGKRGPEGFKPTKPQRSTVRLLIACGFSEPVIAARIGICQMTLRKHFADDLAFGRDYARAENLERLNKAATSGNVTAMKHLDSKLEAASAEASFVGGEARTKLGKKEEAEVAAESAGVGTEWGNDLGLPN